MHRASLAVADAAPAMTEGRNLAYSEPMSLEEDSALMLAYAKRDDVGAFERLYRRHKDAVFRYLLRQCGSRATAEDVFQEAWSRVIRARARYRPTAKFSTFLYRVAHNCLIDHYRRDRRHSAGEFDEQQHAADEAGPLEDAEKAIMRRRLDAALKELPDEQRDVFLLYEEAGLSVEQIAQVTASKHEAVKSRLRYANRKLRRALAIGEDT